MKNQIISVFALFTIQMRKEVNHNRSSRQVVQDCQALMTYGKRQHNLSVRLCNGDIDQLKYDLLSTRNEQRAQVISDYYGAEVITGGDPRGCVFRLRLASGTDNDCNGNYCIPY